jgi:hypothetical protein
MAESFQTTYAKEKYFTFKNSVKAAWMNLKKTLKDTKVPLWQISAA